MTKYKIFASIMILFGIVSCAFVDLDPDGQNVSVMPNSNSAYFSMCKFLGNTTVSLWDKADTFQNDKLLTRQLNTLARNEAAKMGGDTVTQIATSPDDHISNQATYKVYKCVNKSVKS